MIAKAIQSMVKMSYITYEELIRSYQGIYSITCTSAYIDMSYITYEELTRDSVTISNFHLYIPSRCTLPLRK